MARGNHLILDRYEPIGTAGVGGFGAVQIAWDPRIQRRVAIKTIQLTELDAFRANLPGAQAVAQPASPTADRWHGVMPWDEYLEDDGFGDSAPFEDPDEVTSLSHVPGLDEARTAAMLQDPRIVTVYDFEVRGRVAYLIMEYVEGITLTRLLADYGDFLTLDMIAAVFDAVSGALVVAHKAGVLHLDIKPDNIIINPQGQAKVTDFGLATLADASGTGTTGGGTIGYMPLEQMRREHLDARTDEWSLASVTYEMLTGDNPFRVRGLDHAEAAIEDAELILPSLCWENLDEQADDVVFYALDPDREERYASVADFAEEMDKFLGDADAGRDQLALVVADALGLAIDGGDDGEGDADDWDEGEPESPRGPGLFARLFGRTGGDSADDGLYDDYDDYADDDAGTRPRGRRRSLRSREDEPVLEERPVREPRPPRDYTRLKAFLFRAVVVIGSGVMTWFAMTNLPFVPTAFDVSTTFMIAVAVAVVAAIAAFAPPIGALVALGLLGVAAISVGRIAEGAIIVAIAIALAFMRASGKRWLVVVGVLVAAAAALVAAYFLFTITPQAVVSVILMAVVLLIALL